MGTMLDRLADGRWFERNKGKLGGFVMGSLGTIVLALFVVVAITGEPYGRTFEPSPNVVYPDW